MAEKFELFGSPDLKARFDAAYQAVLNQWPVPYEELTISTRFGATHVIASGQREAPPVVLLPPGGSYAPMWVRNVGPASQSYRTYAVDIIGELRAIGKVAGARYRPTINSAVPRIFSDEELLKIRTPVLLLIGDHEVIYKPEKAIRRATRLVSGLKAEIVPGANHSAQYTAPDFVNARILEFLAD